MRCLVVPLLAAAACTADPSSLSEGKDTAGEAADGGGDEGTTPGDTDAGAPVASCDPQPIPTELTLMHEGRERRAIVVGPSTSPSVPMPVVLNFHGYSNSAELQRSFSAMDAHASDSGYLAVYPQGTGLPSGWNAGACCGNAALEGVDDVGFVDALIEHMAETLCIDQSRIYAVGYSNGGFLAHRLACELSDKIAGVGAVAGVIGIPDCQPERSIPVMQIHGTADTVVPYIGSLSLGFPSVDATVEGWRERQGCEDTPSTTFEQGDATCVEWPTCSAGVSLCTISLGGHTWPGGTVPLAAGKTSRDLDANAAFWEFFESHPLP